MGLHIISHRTNGAHGFRRVADKSGFKSSASRACGAAEKRRMRISFVTLSVGKGPTNASRGLRFFASLRMRVGIALFQQPLCIRQH